MNEQMFRSGPRSTRVSGYVVSPVRKACATCEYLVSGSLCRNKLVQRDAEIPGAGNGLKRVNANDGCCNEWEAREAGGGGQYAASDEMRPEDMSTEQLEAVLRAKGM